MADNVDRFKTMELLQRDKPLTDQEKDTINQLSEQEMKEIESLYQKISGQLSNTDRANVENLRRKMGPIRDKLIIPAWF